MRVIVLHNVYEDSEGRHVRMWDGYQSGDPLVPVIEYDPPRSDERHAHDEIVALEEAFFLFNVGETELAQRYRAARNRSLSVGDVVRVDDAWYSCEKAGWKLLDEAPADSIVYRDVHGTTSLRRGDVI